MGFEALSRGFEQVCFIEKDKKTFFLLKDNAKKLGIEPQFFMGDTLKVLKKTDSDFDVIYVDPPYQSGLYDSVLEIVRLCDVLKKDGIIILEHPSRLEINIDGFELIKKRFMRINALLF